jgi:hypothetical protein
MCTQISFVYLVESTNQCHTLPQTRCENGWLVKEARRLGEEFQRSLLHSHKRWTLLLPRQRCMRTYLFSV